VGVHLERTYLIQYLIPRQLSISHLFPESFPNYSQTYRLSFDRRNYSPYLTMNTASEQNPDAGFQPNGRPQSYVGYAQQPQSAVTDLNTAGQSLLTFLPHSMISLNSMALALWRNR
jgi:hypothetical protein